MSRIPALLLLLFLPLLMGMRPCESIDGGTPDTGQTIIEWGMLGLDIQRQQAPATVLSVPQVVARLGVSDQLELGARGNYRMSLGPGQLPWEGTFSAGDLGVYGKWALLTGGLRHRAWTRPSVAILLGAEFLTLESLWGVEARLAASMWIGPVLTHLNIGFHYEDHPRVAVGAVVTVPLSFGLTPVVEASGEVRYGSYPSAASVLLGATYEIPRAPLLLDLGVRRGLAPGAPDWTVLTGITMKLSLWHPAGER